MRANDLFDGAIRPLSEIVAALGGLVEQVGSTEQGAVFTVESIDVALPLELGVRSHLGRAAGVTATTPLRTATSFSSVCHDLRLRIELDHAG